MTGIAILALAAAPALQTAFPRLEDYRLCGVKIAARLERERPTIAPDVLARDATLRCDPLLGAAAEETAARARPPQDRARIMTEFRQRSIADLAFRISTLRARRKEAAQ